MRVLLVTLSQVLPIVKNNILNPELDYCAIVVDDTELAKDFIRSIGGDENIIYPFYELNECINNFYYNFVLCFSDTVITNQVARNFKDCNLPKNKLVHLYYCENGENPFIIKRNLHYLREHANEFDMFATGASTASVGLDNTQFINHKLFNSSRSAEDLYYNYQNAKLITDICRGGVALCFNLSCAMQFSLRSITNI